MFEKTRSMTFVPQSMIWHKLTSMEHPVTIEEEIVRERNLLFRGYATKSEYFLDLMIPTHFGSYIQIEQLLNYYLMACQTE